MTGHFADRVLDAVREKQVPACIGFDPLVDRLPRDLLRDAGVRLTESGGVAPGVSVGAVMEAVLAFGRALFEVAARHVPVIKINIAFFEPYHADGVQAYLTLVKQARDAGLIVIGDVKRADIGHTSAQYALAHLKDDEQAGVVAPDAITVNPYFGIDGVRPFIDVARDTGRGVFVLVQTSNPSAAEVQGIGLSDGSTVGERVADLVGSWACVEGLIGESGYSNVGAVVSPRATESTERIRALLPRCLFLVPGFGAQGRTVREVAKCFKPDGTGAIVNASRSVIYAYQDQGYRESVGDDWRRCIEAACRDFVSAVRDAVPR